MSESFVDAMTGFAQGAARHWWVLVLRGALAIVIGAMALIWPGITLAALVIVLGAFALVDGIFSAVAAFRAERGEKTPLVIAAVAGIGFGIVALFWPGITLLVLTLLIGAWALVRGIVEIAGGIGLPKGEQGKTWVIVAGVLSTLFGLLVLFWPISGAFAMAVVLGIYAVIVGVMLVVAGFVLRKMGKDAVKTATQADHELTGGDTGAAV